MDSKRHLITLLKHKGYVSEIISYMPSDMKTMGQIFGTNHKNIQTLIPRIIIALSSGNYNLCVYAYETYMNTHSHYTKPLHIPNHRCLTILYKSINAILMKQDTRLLDWVLRISKKYPKVDMYKMFDYNSYFYISTHALFTSILWFHDHGFASKCYQTYYGAIRHNHLELLHWAHKNYQLNDTRVLLLGMSDKRCSDDTIVHVIESKIDSSPPEKIFERAYTCESRNDIRRILSTILNTYYVGENAAIMPLHYSMNKMTSKPSIPYEIFDWLCQEYPNLFWKETDRT